MAYATAADYLAVYDTDMSAERLSAWLDRAAAWLDVQMGDKLDPSDKSEAEAKLQNLKSALTGTDSDAIKAATEELKQVFYKISEKLYQAQGGQPGAGFDPSQAGPTPGGQGGQDYYDADYTVVDDDNK